MSPDNPTTMTAMTARVTGVERRLRSLVHSERRVSVGLGAFVPAGRGGDMVRVIGRPDRSASWLGAGGCHTVPAAVAR